MTRVVVLDDDPTGTQTSADLPVLVDPEADPAPFLATDDAVHVLTNTRALPERRAVDLLRDVRARVDEAAAGAGTSVEYVLRGDSTLRGHVFAESDVFGAADGVLLFVPAFPAAGRTTIDGVHYVQVGEHRMVAADTEFARDPVFGYTARTMVDWVCEVSGRQASSIPLDVVRERSTGGLARALVVAAPGTVVVPDVETDGDIDLVSGAVDMARDAGASVVVRCAAPLASARTGHAAAVPVPRSGSRRDSALVVCGSHTEASTQQLSALAEYLEVPIRSISTAAALDAAGDEGARVAAAATKDMDARGIAIIASERTRRSEHDGLHHGAAVMEALCGAVARLRERTSAVITKGGITSADVARVGLGVSSARVRGPLFTGIALWQISVGKNDVDYVVVPGNVGGPRTLIEVSDALGIGPRDGHVRSG